MTAETWVILIISAPLIAWRVVLIIKVFRGTIRDSSDLNSTYSQGATDQRHRYMRDNKQKHRQTNHV